MALVSGQSKHGATAVPLTVCPYRNKGKITSAWNSSAEAYVGAVQERGQGGGLAAGMSVGYKLAARLVNSLSNKVHFPRSRLYLNTPLSAMGASAGVFVLLFSARLLTMVPANHNIVVLDAYYGGP